MSVTSPTAQERFTLSIFKYHVSRPDKIWVNTYELRAGDSPTAAEIANVALNLVNYEREFHLTTTRFDRWVLSSWVEDSNPYNPDAFVSTSLSVNGLADVGSGDTEPLQMVLFVKRQVASGRYGKLFYRNVLREEDVVTVAGIPTLSNPVAMQNRIDDAVDNNDLAEELSNDDSIERITMESTGSSRNVTGFVVAGVRFVSLDHRYFDVA